MTQERYLKMCEQMGKEPDEEEMPPSLNDLPEIVIIALEIFSCLGDRIYPEIGYTGKDFTNLDTYINIYGVENKELLLEILNILESRAIELSRKQLKAERDKLKRKK